MQGGQEKGFVLVTVMVLTAVLSIMGIGLYYRSVIQQQVSKSSYDTIRAQLYAESAINMVTWALYQDSGAVDPYSGWDHDADLDGITVAGIAGDRAALQANYYHPGTQVRYFDNRPLNQRAVVFDPASPPQPDLSSLALPTDVYGNPGFLGLGVDSYGNLAAPQLGVEPTDGAVLWLTAFDVNPQNLVVDGKDIHVTTENDYGIAAYAIGIVNGHRLRMFRAEIGRVAPSPPIGLGSVTNARD